MLEKDVEAELVKLCKGASVKLGVEVLCLKFTSPQRRNVPDRIVIFPPGLVTFIELKAPGGKLTEGQHREHQRLRALKCSVIVLDSVKSVREWVKQETFNAEDDLT